MPNYFGSSIKLGMGRGEHVEIEIAVSRLMQWSKKKLMRPKMAVFLEKRQGKEKYIQEYVTWRAQGHKLGLGQRELAAW